MTYPLIFLPGMMCDARLFAPQIAALQGEREVSTAPITGADNMVDLARTVLQNAPDRFAMAGLSMGGIVAMEVVRQAPERVAGLALLDTNPLAENDNIKALRLPQMEKARAGQLADVMRNEMKPNYLSDGARRAEVLDLCMDMALDLGPQVFCRQSVALMNRPDQSQTLRDYKGHALVLCGRDDALCPVFRHEYMHDLMPQSTLQIIENAGHLPTLEQPEHTTAALQAWLKETDNG